MSERNLKRERVDVDPIVEGVFGVGEAVIFLDSIFHFLHDFSIVPFPVRYVSVIFFVRFPLFTVFFVRQTYYENFKLR